MSEHYRFGIEEEFFLADAATRGTPGETRSFHEEVRAKLPKVERELMQAQVEIASPPATRCSEARDVLSSLRAELAGIGHRHGIALLAAGTHPLARWEEQRTTEKERYQTFLREAQMVERRNIVCGMHVHVEVPRPEDRVDLMNRLLPYVPLLLALSTSSPFWQGRDTGLAGYRLSVWGELPRTGLPDIFRDTADYERYVAALVGAEAIADASYIWWTVRPSIHFPTLELRVADSCTRLDDTLAIAALYRCVVRMLVRRPALNAGPTGAARAIATENLWRAQRHGVGAFLIDEAGGPPLPLASRLDKVLAELADDAAALGCEDDVARTRAIVSGGTSAERQREVFATAQARGEAPAAALAAVVDWIASATTDA